MNLVRVAQRLQQQINHGRQRLARMTGQEEPSAEELRANLHKRILSLEESGLALGKRYNHKAANVVAAKLYPVGPALNNAK